MNIGPYTLQQYLSLAQDFHGSITPGMVIGGYMVDLAQSVLTDGAIYDALSETPRCLPDAIQLLTPCSMGNGRLTVADVGRVALTLYDRLSGEGVRVYLDAAKLRPYPAIADWHLRRRPREEQNNERLLSEVRSAGLDILSHEAVRVRGEYLRHAKDEAVMLCPGCGEPYPIKHGPRCRACQGKSPYLDQPA